MNSPLIHRRLGRTAIVMAVLAAPTFPSQGQEAVNLTHHQGSDFSNNYSIATHPADPDGVYFIEGGSLRRGTRDGNEPAVVRDDTLLYAITDSPPTWAGLSSPLFTIADASGATVEIGDGVLSDYQLLPGGKWVLFFRVDDPSEPNFLTYLIAPIDGSRPPREVGRRSGRTYPFSLLSRGDRFLFENMPDGPNSAIHLNVFDGPSETLTEAGVLPEGVRPMYGVFSPVDARFYVATVDLAGTAEIARWETNGGPPEPLILPQTPGSRPYFYSLAVTPDGSTLLYRDTADDAAGLGLLYAYDLTSEAVVATIPVPYQHELHAVGDETILSSGFGPLPGIYRVDIAGAELVRLDVTPVADFGFSRIEASTADGTIVFTGTLSGTDQRNLFAVSATGGDVRRLNQSLPVWGNVRDYPIRVASGFVYYLADDRVDHQYELYSVPLAGGAPSLLSAPPVPGGDVDDFALSPDGQTVYYLADLLANSVDEVFAAPSDGSGAAPIKVSRPRTRAEILAYRISPDGRFVVYLAEADEAGKAELFSVPIDGGPVLRISGALPPSGDVEPDFAFTPDSRFVLYRADQDLNTVDELFLARVEGGPPVKLNPHLVEGRDVKEFRLSPDGRRVFYRADHRIHRIQDVHSVALDGSGFLTYSDSSSDVRNFAVSGDGLQLAFSSKFPNALYLVPAAGGVPDQKSSLSSDRSFQNLSFSPDGEWILADVRGEGSSSMLLPTRNTTPVFSRLNRHLGFTPDSRQALFESGSVIPLDGGLSIFIHAAAILVVSPSGDRLLLSGFAQPRAILSAPALFPSEAVPLATGLTSLRFPRFDGTGEFVFYGEADRLFRMPSDGSGPAEIVNPTVPLAGEYPNSLLDYALSPACTHAAFYGLEDDATGLFVTDLRDATTRRVNGPLADGAYVADVWQPAMRFTDSGSHLVYISHEQSATIGDLYSLRVLPDPPSESLAVWAARYDLQSFADADRDLFPDLVEFAFGTSPVDASEIPAIRARVGEFRPRRFLEIQAPALRSEEVTVTVEASGDTLAWETIAELQPAGNYAAINGAAVVTGSGTADKPFVIRDNVAFDEDSTRYLRLRVTLR